MFNAKNANVVELATPVDRNAVALSQKFRCSCEFGLISRLSVWPPKSGENRGHFEKQPL
jgi:hypothetical protein